MLQSLRDAVFNDYAWIAANAAAAVVVLAVLWKRGLFSRSAWMAVRRDVNEHKPIVWLCCAVLVYLSAAVALGLAMGLSGMRLGTMTGSLKSQALLSLTVYAVSLPIGILLLVLVRGSAPAAGLECPPKSLALGGTLLAAVWPILTCIGAAATSVYVLVSGSKADDVAHSTLKSLIENSHDPWVWLQTLLAVIAAPVQEEIIYRAFLQSAIASLTGRIWASVLITSVLFAAAHTGLVPVYGQVELFALSVCFGFAFERTKRLGVAIGMHIAFNAVNVAMALYQH